MSNPNPWVNLQKQRRPSDNPWLALQEQQPEEPEDTNVFTALGAGFVRGATEPFTIIKPVREVSERMKQYRGDELGTKVGYGVGYLAGFLLPTTLEFKLADKLVRGANWGGKLVAADKLADLTRAGLFTRGAVTGALYGAGQHAEDPGEYIRGILVNAGIGGVADVAIPAAWSALSARFGNRVNPSIRELLEEAAAEADTPPALAADAVVDAPAAPQFPPVGQAKRAMLRADARLAGVSAHARAMQLLEQMDGLTTPASAKGFNAAEATMAPTIPTQLEGPRPTPDLVGEGLWKTAQVADPAMQAEAAVAIAEQVERLAMSSSAMQSTAARRLALQLAIQQMDLPTLKAGEIRMIPAPHGDASDLSDILRRVPELDVRVPVRPDDPHVLVSFKDTKGLGDAAVDFAEHGFARGQEVLYRGSKWVAMKPTKAGDKVYITQPGRIGRPLLASRERLQFLPTIQDMRTTATLKNVAPTAEEFIERFTLWPDGGLENAFNQFAKEKLLNASDRIALKDRLVKWQRKALSEEDSMLGETLETLDKELARLDMHPDGLLDELVAQKGLTYIQIMKNGQWHYVLKDSGARPLSPPLRGEQEALAWVRSYGVDSAELVPGSPLAEQVVPSAGVSSVKPHTAGELSGVHFSPVMNLTADLMPRASFFKFAEDTLLANGIQDIRPYTGIFVPLMEGKLAYQSELKTWLKGGVADGKKVKGLLDIFSPDSKKVRADKKELIVDLLEQPRTAWSAFAKEAGLNEQEVQVARELREFYNEIFERFVKDDKITITADDFIENYFPHYRRNSDATAAGSVAAALKRKKLELNKGAIKFLSEMQRDGVMTKWDKDPFAVTLKYLRSGLYKSHLKQVSDEAVDVINSIPHDLTNASKDIVQLKSSLINYVNLSRYGAPEAFTAINTALENTARSLGIRLSETNQERLINTYLTLNYGAFLGFRPALVLRNLTQIFVTGYPLLGGRYLGHGLSSVTTNPRAAFEEAKRVGVIAGDHVPLPMADALYADLSAVSLEARGMASKAKQALLKTSELGMKWFTQADDINRATIYFGQKRKVIDAQNKLMAGEISEEKFLRQSGLNYFGRAVTEEYQRRFAAHGNQAAAEWLGKLAAWDSQWIYHLGAGPALFAHGLGRLAGQYGTWPMWYGAYMAQGVKNLKGIDRALFLARNVAMHQALVAGGAAVGLNLSRWTGLSSLGWMGGPAVDMFTDFRDVVTGVSPSGEATAKRAIALSNYGMRDDGDGVSMLPSLLGGRIEMEDPMRYAVGVLSHITPGYLAGLDIYKSTQEPDAASAAAKILGLPLATVGHEWPEVR